MQKLTIFSTWLVFREKQEGFRIRVNLSSFVDSELLIPKLLLRIRIRTVFSKSFQIKFQTKS
jgi:hypothetical protein